MFRCIIFSRVDQGNHGAPYLWPWRVACGHHRSSRHMGTPCSPMLTAPCQTHLRRRYVASCSGAWPLHDNNNVNESVNESVNENVLGKQLFTDEVITQTSELHRPASVIKSL